jgi:hypothetical protein
MSVTVKSEEGYMLEIFLGQVGGVRAVEHEKRGG